MIVKMIFLILEKILDYGYTCIFIFFSLYMSKYDSLISLIFKCFHVIKFLFIVFNFMAYPSNICILCTKIVPFDTSDPDCDVFFYIINIFVYCVNSLIAIDLFLFVVVLNFAQ